MNSALGFRDRCRTAVASRSKPRIRQLDHPLADDGESRGVDAYGSSAITLPVQDADGG